MNGGTGISDNTRTHYNNISTWPITYRWQFTTFHGIIFMRITPHAPKMALNIPFMQHIVLLWKRKKCFSNFKCFVGQLCTFMYVWYSGGVATAVVASVARTRLPAGVVSQTHMSTWTQQPYIDIAGAFILYLCASGPTFIHIALSVISIKWSIIDLTFKWKGRTLQVCYQLSSQKDSSLDYVSSGMGSVFIFYSFLPDTCMHKVLFSHGWHTGTPCWVLYWTMQGTGMSSMHFDNHKIGICL